MAPEADAENIKPQMVRIPPQVHREVKIEGVHLKMEIGEVLAMAWALYKQNFPKDWRSE